MSDSNELSILGPSTRVTGRISGKGGLQIEGRVEGDVSITGPAIIADGAAVEGDFAAESLDLGGVVTGNVTTTGGVVIRGGARLRGEIRSAGVAIEPGAKVSVRLNTPFEIEL
jgi:cytoskeletal protein CcmA (bactofilin family)